MSDFIESYIKLRFVSVTLPAGETTPPAPKINGGGQASLGLARLNDHKANPDGAVKVGAESAMHFNLDGPGWVCYRPNKYKAVYIVAIIKRGFPQ